jgi:hypothetical protein
MDGLYLKITLCCLCLSLTGCASHQSIPYQNTKHKPSQNVKAKFSFPSNRARIKIIPYSKQQYELYNVSYLKFESAGDNGQHQDFVDAIYYKSKLPGKHRLAIVLPIWGGSKYPPDGISNYLFRHSQGKIDIIRVIGDKPILDIEVLQEAKTIKAFHILLKTLRIRIKNTLTDINHLVNWASKQKHISKKHITIIGFSKSSVIAGIVAQINPHITGAIFVMGGSNPAEMIYYCDYYEIQKKITRRFHWTPKKLNSVLHHYLSPIFNVASYPMRLDPCRVLIFDSYYDTCIDQHTREELWNAMGQPERISFYAGHKGSFGSMTLAGGYFMRCKIMNFIFKNNCSVHDAQR